MTVLPKQIQAQLDAAEAIQRELAASQAPEAPPSEQPVAQTPAEPPAPPAPAEQPAQTTPVAAEQPAPAAPEQDADYWKNRFKTVEGKLNAEMPQLYQQLKERDQQLQQMAATLEELKKPKAPEQPKQPLVTDKDVEEFGSDLVDFVKRMNRQENAELAEMILAQVRKEIREAAAPIGAVQEKLVQDSITKFWADVRSAVPDWDEVDKNPDWIAFLNSTPEFAEETYRQLASRAINTGNAVKIAKLVETWRKTLPPTPVPAAAQAKTELQRQVAPPKNASAASPSAPVQTYTGADYQYWNDPRRANDTPAADLAVWRQTLEQAHQENRIQW